MSITTAMTSVPKPASDLIEAFRGAPTSVISDNLARLPGAVGLRPFHRSSKLVGIAFTVRTRPGDNLAIHKALELVGPGDVIVVDGGGDETRALVGEIMMTIAQYRGAAGYVIDGAIRDVAAFAASDFPCFARTAIHRGPYKSGPGEINVPVSIGGSVISPGDRGRRRGRRGVVSRRDGSHLAGSRSRPDHARGANHHLDPRRPLPGQLRQVLIDARRRQKNVREKPQGGTMSQKDEFHNLDNPAD